MFFEGSRYQTAGSVTCTLPDGRMVSATKIPRPTVRTLLGYHRRDDLQRLDHIAYHYLQDASAFWRLCDANGTPCPDALAARRLVGVPPRER
jgi:hypothetical protein